MGEGRSCTRLVFSLAAESPKERAQLQVCSSCPSPSTPMQMLTWHTRPPLQPGQANMSVWPRPFFFFSSPYMQTVQWLQYPCTPACLNCAGIKHQPLRTSCVTSTPVLARSLVPLRGREGQPSPDLAWSWISPATAGPKQVLKAACFPVSYQVSAEGSTASQFLLVPTRDIGLGSEFLPASTHP